jgi:hypothetical protein
MKHFYALLILLMQLQGIAQTSEDNIGKYWTYRDRLRKNFLKIGTLPGESIPMTARRIDWAFSGQGASPWPNASAVYFSDATIYLGHYIMVLATEYKLTNDHIQSGIFQNDDLVALTNQKLQTQNELYYAIQAINRLDNQAEYYLSQGTNTQSPDDQNGFFLRDDVPKPFFANFLNDYSNIFNTECSFEFTDGDYYAFPEYPNDPGDSWPDIPLDQMQNIPNEAQRTFYNKNFMSLDQVTTIFSGLRCVYDLVGDDLVQPTPNDESLNLRLESKEIVHRILNYIVHEETCPGNDPCFSFQIKNILGRINIPGSDLSTASPFIFSIGRHFNYPLFNNWVSEGLSNVRVAFMMDSPELIDIVDDLNWNRIIAMGELLPAQITQMFNIDPSDFDLPISVDYPCVGNLLDRLEEKGNEPINIGTMPLSQLMILMDEFQEQDIQMVSGNSEICFDLTPEILEAIVHLDIDVQGFYCDNVGLAISKLIAVITVSSLAASSNLLTSFGVMAWIAELNEEPSFCIQSANNNSLSEDNVHIFQELATISERLSASYVHGIAESSGLDYYTMLRAVLDPSSQAIDLLNFEHYKNDFMNTAPCEGTWGLPETGGDFQNPAFCSGNNWASRNRLFHAKDSQFGANTPEFRGEYAGLDFMLYYNLYHLLWGVELPPYARKINCKCIEEITMLPNLESTLNVIAKFPDYKAKGIPIESFLAHDLTVNTTSGILNVKTDLIICNELPDVHTTLLCTNSASINLFADNTITVRSGNKIHLTEGSVLNAGLNEVTGQSHYATIILEENAELIVDDGASIICQGGLKLVMKTGSKFTLHDATCLSSAGSDESIFFEAQSAEISLLHAQLVCQSNIADRNSHFAQSVFVADASEVVFQTNPTSTNSYLAQGCWFDIMDQSNLRISAPFRHEAGNILFAYESTLLIEDGDLVIADDCRMNWQSQSCRINHAESKLTFDNGHLQLPPYYSFMFTYDEVPHGYIEVLPGSENVLLNGLGSHFYLNGEDNDDLVMKINNGAHFQNANFGFGDIKFGNCKIDMTGGNIFTDLNLTAKNVSITGGQIHPCGI